MNKLKIYNTHCCGEIGDVVIGGYKNLRELNILQESRELLKDNKLRNFLLNEPRGGVFKHYNLVVPSRNKKAQFGFIILEPEDNPPMSGSNSICVATVLLEKNFIKIIEPETNFFLEAPGGIVKVKAQCLNKSVNSIEIENLPSYVDKLDAEINLDDYGKILVSTAYGGDSFVVCKASDFNLKIIPQNAKQFVNISYKILKAANEQIGFKHPELDSLNYISFCQFVEPVNINSQGIKEAKNTVCIRPGKLDRSPCGTGTSARLALMREKKEIDINEVFISKSIIDSKFYCRISQEYIENDKKYIRPKIKGSAFISGYQEFYLDKDDPFPEGYRLNDTWPTNL
ncbi:MAG: 4-hydroxyproline 2-epimerase 1 [Alphaproteobacteria bacterium MarineAlpha5_Bin9]|nr:MAG: 4-hydroxyproline 2-epimerase 1 [Alphaproteobacteria bacterium MarineAlpha5_Bin9]|tara:strand:- start:1753 stop:2778 length:1026 start_codon:yes stop_codon:yes gene_type:complete